MLGFLGMNKKRKPLIRNTLVFLDTGFFKNYKATDRNHLDFLKYAKEEKLTFCTSHICLEEWRSQKTQNLRDFLNTATTNYNTHTRQNPISDEILSPYPLRHPSAEEIDEKSKVFIDTFVADNNIVRYMPTENHVTRTWEAYFSGFPPFSRRKNREDIPDSWVFEAARDMRFDEEYRGVTNRFCIGGDKNLNSNFESLGLKPITVTELLEILKQEEDASVAIPTIETVANPMSPNTPIADASAAISADSDLNQILETAISAEIREIYIRILGYVFWLSTPSKAELFSLIENRGLNRALIEAAGTILSQPNLQIIQDTGNHYLPVNKSICENAANLVMTEIIEILDTV